MNSEAPVHSLSSPSFSGALSHAPQQMERFQQTEERLQQLLAVSQKQSEAGMRLSSKDWADFRKRLMRLWALRSDLDVKSPAPPHPPHFSLSPSLPRIASHLPLGGNGCSELPCSELLMRIPGA